MAANAHQTDYTRDDDSDSNHDNEEEEEEAGGGSGKQNGAVNRFPDRFGFLGGDQYTDPGG